MADPTWNTVWAPCMARSTVAGSPDGPGVIFEIAAFHGGSHVEHRLGALHGAIESCGFPRWSRRDIRNCRLSWRRPRGTPFGRLAWRDRELRVPQMVPA